MHQAAVTRVLAVAPLADDGGALEHSVNASLAARRVAGLNLAQPVLEPLDTWQDWTERRDAGLSSALHHAAALGLQRTYAALAQRGSAGGYTEAEWAANAAGDTPAGLLEGVPAVAAPLHRVLRERGLVSVAMARALCCSSVAEDALLPPATADALAEAATALQAGLPEDALAALEPLTAEGPDAARCARVYAALALLEAGYGAVAARAELDAYTAETDAACAAASAARAPPPHVDPLYLYARFATWVAAAAKDGVARSSRSARIAAADALRAARLFPAIADAWIEPGDDLDVRIAAEGGGGTARAGALAAPSDEHDTHDTVGEPEPGPGTPEFEWRVAKRDLKATSRAMDELMSLTGLTAVKRTAMTMLKEVLLARSRPPDVKSDVCMVSGAGKRGAATSATTTPAPRPRRTCSSSATRARARRLLRTCLAGP